MQKVLFIINDGVSLRNFVYSDFFFKKRDFNVEVWYDLPFELKLDGVKTEKIKLSTNSLTDLLKVSYINSKLKQLSREQNDTIFLDYIFTTKTVGFKNRLKSFFRKLVVFTFKSNSESILKLIEFNERYFGFNTELFHKLKNVNPALIFFTSQRSSNFFQIHTIAKKINTKTATFIFSWDNPPKATLLYKTDFFFVWSDFMKKELTSYYKFTHDSKILVTGTPQFEFHFKQYDEHFMMKSIGLDSNSQYVCFTGDDFTSSPQDHLYLKDFASQIHQYNLDNSTNFKIIFRPCPVDFSSRYDDVLKEYDKLIIKIQPKWQKIGSVWNSIIPEKEDNIVLKIILQNSIFVTNLGSSIVFDAACNNTPCAFVNYNPDLSNIQKDVNRAYKYKHFESMTNKNSVFWINEPKDWKMILEVLSKNTSPLNNIVQSAQKWFEVINQQPADQASERIVKAIDQIISKYN